MSTLPIFDYGAPVEDGDAKDVDSNSSGPAAESQSKVPTPISDLGSAIVPPQGANDLVSRAQWQWAVGESETAVKSEFPKPGTTPLPAGRNSATKKRPSARPRAVNPPTDPSTKNQPDSSSKANLPPPVPTSTTSQHPRTVAETAIARVEVEEARLKLKVVERLLEDRPVELSDEDSESPQTSERAFLKLTALVKPLTGEEFMSACEERCLSGLCGWPLCAVPLEQAKRLQNSKIKQRRKIGGENGIAGAVVGGKGTYRIDAVNRKVYLREDLEMFCCDVHRAMAEKLGVSLALSLDPVGKHSEGDKNKNENTENADSERNSKLNAAKAKAMGDANKNVKAGVFEKMPPTVVERNVSGVNNSPPSLEGLLGGKAAAVEGYVPREAWKNKNTKTKTRQKGVTFDETGDLKVKSSDLTGTTSSQPPLEVDGGMVSSSLNPRMLDLQLEKQGGPDDSTLTNGGTNVNGDKAATFYFNVFGEGTEAAAKGANAMGAFSEGQLSRVLPEAAAVELGLADSDTVNDSSPENLSENCSDAANDASDAAAMAEASAAAEAALAAGVVSSKAVAELALEKAREALKATLTKVGGQSENGNTQDETDVSDAETSDDDSAVVAFAPGAVSEFGQTWMMLDGWVTRATFAHINGKDSSNGKEHIIGEDPSAPMDTESETSENNLPPRLGYAKAMSETAAREMRRALPAVRQTLNLTASTAGLEKSLGDLLRTFFFDASVPGLRPERWALLVTVMLDWGVSARAAALSDEKNMPSIVEDIANSKLKNGGLWQIVEQAGATKEEYHAFGDLLAGECAKSW